MRTCIKSKLHLHIVDGVADKEHAARSHGPIAQYSLGHSRVGLVHVHQVLRLQIAACARLSVPLMLLVQQAVAVDAMSKPVHV